jgi:hypothetical protein
MDSRYPPDDGSTVPAVTEFQEFAPVFPVRDLLAGLEHYRRLGFDVRAYNEEVSYGFARRGRVNLHLTGDPAHDPARSTSAAYLYVSDADALFAEWRESGAGGRFEEPYDTEYGLREGVHIDPEGNLIRYGSPLS